MIRRLDLSYPGREARGALDVCFDCGGWPLRMIATHFGLATKYTQKLVTKCLRRAERLYKAKDKKRT